MEQANAFQQRQQYNPYSNTYNPGWRDHPNFSYRNNSAQNLLPPNQQQQYQHPKQQQYMPTQGPMNPPVFQKPHQQHNSQGSQAVQPNQTSDVMLIQSNSKFIAGCLQ